MQEPRLSAAASGVRQSVFAALQARIDAHRAAGGDLVPLQIGDTWLPPPEAALTAMPDERELAIYGGVPGLPELREALARRHHARGLVTAGGAANVHVGVGCTHALFCAARAVLDPGDDVLVVSPYWPLIPGVLKTCGANPVEVPLSSRLYREPDLDVAGVLSRAHGSRTRGLYLTTPNNPDGQVWTRSQLEAVAAFARRHDLWVLADEVYADFVYEGEHRSIASFPGMADRTITCHSLSKSHALAGARVGYVIASQRVIDATRRISNHTVYNVPVPMQRAALRALETGEAWLADARARYVRARDAASRALTEVGIPHAMPRGGTFFFVDLSRLLGDRPLQAVLERAVDEGVLVAPGEAFGADYDAHVRLCFTGVQEERVVDGIARLGRALAA
jgi:aspartate/methionine/tyrosine aminotransferase